MSNGWEELIKSNRYNHDCYILNGTITDENIIQLCEALKTNTYIKKIIIAEDARADELPGLCLTGKGLEHLLSSNDLESIQLYCSNSLKYKIDMKLVEPNLIRLIENAKNLQINYSCIPIKDTVRQKDILDTCKDFINSCYEYIMNIFIKNKEAVKNG